MLNRYQTYKEVDINTTNRGKIVVMLYSGAVTFLKKAKMYAEEGDYYNKCKFLNKAQAIVDELNYSLDMQKGKDIAHNLRSLYLFINRFLTQANISNNLDDYDKVISILESLKNAFEEIVSNPEFEEARILNKREMLQNSIKRYV
ncbi:MAG: flagellar export chaperone FliS [Candidatus Cloacimonetes bacterium]|nr:flagellar export chaperone FliS [Candidatus Cloacimonadota bacterium]